jgi:hypothetical protein
MSSIYSIDLAHAVMTARTAEITGSVQNAHARRIVVRRRQRAEQAASRRLMQRVQTT